MAQQVRPVVVAMTLLAVSLGITAAAAFAPAAVKHLASYPSSALSLASNGEPSHSLPFFAAPAFSSASNPTGAAASGTPQSATVTLRLPLGTLFDGRDYTFVTESNVRGYEWTAKETDILLDDLMDAALGNLGGAEPGGDLGLGASVRDSANASPLAMITDYELSQIVLVPTSDWDPSSLGLGNRYDVYDGQQRLVTLNLLLAGLRDSFRSEADELNARKGGGGKRAVALAATADEIGGMLMPAKVRKEDVPRIALRRRDDVLLRRILTGVGSIEDLQDDDDGKDAALSVASPTQTYSKLTPKQRSNLLSPLSPANARIFHNFVRLSDRLASLTTRERLRLLDYVVERVHLLVCIPETSRIARNIVMSQGRRGMDNEPVDDFKGLVCFRYTMEEGDMYRTFDMWDALAAEPPSDSDGPAGISSAAGDARGVVVTEPVGRDVVASACLLRASASLRTKIRSRGGDEVYEWERWLRQELWLRNRRQSQHQQQQPWQGKDFFVEEIEPASVALRKLRAGRWDDFAFLSKTSISRKKDGMTKQRREMAIARLEFLRDVVAGVTSAKEAEIAVLELLLRAEEDYKSGDEIGALVRYLDELLPMIEVWTLWMALARPSPMQRHARVFALLDAMDDLDAVGSTATEVSGGVGEMANSLRECMDGYEFGATAGGKRLAAAVLKRMNFHLLSEEKKGAPLGSKAETASVDLIQQQWPNQGEGEEWANRIGNLALVSSPPPRGGGRAKKRASDSSSWESKRKRYEKEPWPLTCQLAKLDQWDVDMVRDQQRNLVSLMGLAWSLENL